MNGALIVSTKDREVWIYERHKKITEVATLLQSAGVSLVMHCKSPACPDPRIRLVGDHTDPEGRILECGCKRRILEHAAGHAPLTLRKH